MLGQHGHGGVVAVKHLQIQWLVAVDNLGEGPDHAHVPVAEEVRARSAPPADHRHLGPWEGAPRGVARPRYGVGGRGIAVTAAAAHRVEHAPRVLRRRERGHPSHRVIPHLVLGARQRDELAPPRGRHPPHEPVGQAPPLEELAHRMLGVVAQRLVDDSVVGARRLGGSGVHEPRPLSAVLGRHAGAGWIPARDRSSDPTRACFQLHKSREKS